MELVRIEDQKVRPIRSRLTLLRLLFLIGTFACNGVFAQISFFNESEILSNLNDSITTTEHFHAGAFGKSVSIEGDKILVSGEMDPGVPGVDAYGLVKLYRRNSSNSWDELQTFYSPYMPLHYDTAVAIKFGFGEEVQITHNQIFIADASDSLDAANVNPVEHAGAIYIYEADSIGTWSLFQKLVAPSRTIGDFFGCSFRVVGDMLVAGALTGEYIFEKDTTGTWIFDQALAPIPAPSFPVFPFGVELGVSEEYILIGDPYTPTNGVFIYEKDGAGSWTEVQKLPAIGTPIPHFYGGSIDILGDEMVIGVPLDSVGLPSDPILHGAGSVFYYQRDSTGTWQESAKIVSPFRTLLVSYGNKVILKENHLWVASYFDDLNEFGLDPLGSAGSAHHYKKDASGNWELNQRFVASDRAWGSVFGYSMDFSQGTLVVGSKFRQFEDSEFISPEDGAAYVFEECQNCNTLTGNVYADLNENCIWDSTEFHRQGLLVSANNGSMTYYGLVDSTGTYSIIVPNGTYTLEIYLDPYWGISPCAIAMYSHTFNVGMPETATYDFPLSADILCQNLWVDIATPSLLRCFENDYAVSYCNTGTLNADSAYIEILFDDYLTPLSSTIPWEVPVVGNLYRFHLGTVPIGECGNFSVTTLVDCDSTVLGQTHCVEAHIFPDSICEPPSPLWDESSIRIEEECITEDTVKFTVRNLGADMLAPGGLFVVEDAVFRLDTSVEISGGSELIFTYPTNGSTFTCAFEQSQHHPGNSNPLVSVEGCGTNSSGLFSLGYVTIYPQDEGDDFIAIDCQQNVGSYDPNDKTGYPMGFGEDHEILDSTELEYKIRFQNTGTAAAQRVVIRDTLAEEFDLTTVETGASSHSYTFDIYGDRILEWTFENIQLPDSGTNEPASHGFVNFRVSQRPGNVPGTVLNNSAAIYFDFNDPIITNETWHMISDIIGVYIEDSLITDVEPVTHLGLKAYPNPSASRVNFELLDIGRSNFQFEVLDANGRMVLQTKYQNTDRFVFDRTALVDGMYLFRIITDTGKFAAGKLYLK